MPTALFMNICQAVAIEPQTNNLSVLGIIENLLLPKEAFDDEKQDGRLPAAGGAMTAVALLSWVWPKEEPRLPFQAILYVTSPKAKKTELVKIGVSIADDMRRARLIMRFNAFPIDAPGTYIFSIETDGETLIRCPLEVGINPPQKSAIVTDVKSSKTRRRSKNAPSK